MVSVQALSDGGNVDPFQCSHLSCVYVCSSLQCATLAGAAGSEVRPVNVTLTETLRCVTSLATGSP